MGDSKSSLINFGDFNKIAVKVLDMIGKAKNGS